MSEQIILTTGIYDAIKEQIRRKKVSPAEEAMLTNQLRNAKQVLRRELPENIVTVNRIVTIKDHATQEERDYIFVPSTGAKLKKNKFSILSDIALATVGCSVGSVIRWPFKDEERTIEVTKVQTLNA